MKSDWRRSALKLSQVGAISEEAIRAAYWRLVARALPGGAEAIDLEQARRAKRELLTEAGVRIPGVKR